MQNPFDGPLSPWLPAAGGLPLGIQRIAYLLERSPPTIRLLSSQLRDLRKRIGPLRHASEGLPALAPLSA